jgi:hypothetical protein
VNPYGSTLLLKGLCGSVTSVTQLEKLGKETKTKFDLNWYVELLLVLSKMTKFLNPSLLSNTLWKNLKAIGATAEHRSSYLIKMTKFLNPSLLSNTLWKNLKAIGATAEHRSSYLFAG